MTSLRVPGSAAPAHPVQSEVVDYQRGFSDRVIVSDCGAGGVFAVLPCRPSLCFGAYGGSMPAAERRIVSLCRWSLVAAAPICTATAGLIFNIGEGKTALVNRTDAYLPFGILLGLVAWLVACNRRIQNLVRVAATADTADVSGGNIGRSTVDTDCMLARRPLHELRMDPPPDWPAESRHRYVLQTAADLVRLTSAYVCGAIQAAPGRALRAGPAAHALSDHLSDESSQPAGLVNGSIADDVRSDATCSGYARSVVTLPPSTEPLSEGVSAGQCCSAGAVLSVMMTAVIRFGWTASAPGSKAWADMWLDDDSVNRAVFVLSTVSFVILFFPMFTLLWLLVSSYRTQYLRLRVLAAMTDESRSERYLLPYLSLQSTSNLIAFAAARANLVARCTRTNTTSMVLDPTLAVITAMGVSAIGSVVVRQLFLCLEVDTLTKCAISVIVVAAAFIVAVAYYGRRIEQEINRQTRSVAGARWTTARTWLALRRRATGAEDDGGITGRTAIYAEFGGGETRNAATSDDREQLWVLAALFDALFGVMTGDARSPSVLGTSLDGLRWALVLSMLALNTVLAFAIREYQNCVS